MGDRKYREFISRPEIYATVHNVLTVYYNMRFSLTNMDEAATGILAELNRLKD